MYFLHRALKNTKKYSEVGKAKFTLKAPEGDRTFVEFQKGVKFSFNHLRQVVFRGKNRLKGLVSEVKGLCGFDWGDVKYGLFDSDGDIQYNDELLNEKVGYGLLGKLKLGVSQVVIQKVVRVVEAGGIQRVEAQTEQGVVFIGEVFFFVIQFILNVVVFRDCSVEHSSAKFGCAVY